MQELSISFIDVSNVLIPIIANSLEGGNTASNRKVLVKGVLSPISLAALLDYVLEAAPLITLWNLDPCPVQERGGQV